MRAFSWRIGLLIWGLCSFMGIGQRALAGPLRPCIRAVLSSHGKILVVDELAFSNQNESHARRPMKSTFKISKQYIEPNEGLRLNGAARYWADPLWSVELTDSDQDPICPYMLVTDDGEYLVLVGDGLSHNTALSIYRRRDHPGQPFGGSGPDHGILIKHIPLSDLLPSQSIPDGIFDSSPEWFASGTFTFTANDRVLTYKTQWGRTVQINLESGKVAIRRQNVRQVH
jgi:hypothetical protein